MFEDMMTLKSKVRLVLFSILLSTLFYSANAQRIVPAAPQQTAVAITGGTIHVGNGQVIENGTIVFDKGKITYVGSTTNIPSNARTIDAKGKQIYPGLIAPNTDLGLREIELVRSTSDYAETGTFNPGTRSLIAYNTDSKAIPTVRSNGILIAQVVPQGGTVSGASSIMQLDAWNWDDAQYRADDGLHLNWPGFFMFQPIEDDGGILTVNKDYEKQVQEVRDYFTLAKGYNDESSHEDRNINFEAMKGIFDGTKTLFINCDYVREIVNAVNFAKDFKVKMVLVGGADSYMVTDLLKENNIPVILGNVHSLPGGDDVKVDVPYSTAGMLQKAGVNYCLSIQGFWQQRNLPFMAGTTVTYGVSSEDALKSITSNAAKILGIDNITGTLEVGKDANIIISSGDILDMKTNNIETAFIQGRNINLDNSQKQLYEIYMKKYGLK